MKDDRLSGFSNRNPSSHSSGGQRPEIRLSVELGPFRDVRENLFQNSLLAPAGLLEVCGVA